MPEPIFFVVERGAGGREEAVIYHDLLPARLCRKIPKFPNGKPTEVSPIIYTLRVDKLSENDQNFWLSKSCDELLSVYHWLRDEGTLPNG